MINLLHNYLPQPTLFTIGPIDIRWYGLILVLAMVAAIYCSIRFARLYGIKQEAIIDLSIWLIIGGLIGARIYEILLESSYYFSNPAAMIKIWEGGLAIHGGIIGGAIALIIFTHRYKYSGLWLAACIVPGLALGQTIGRWGNWFNQELFGLPTNLPWGIPISLINRPTVYALETYFHPTFLYESIGCLLIFLTLWIFSYQLKASKRRAVIIISAYLILYSTLRFSLEFIKIDSTPEIAGWRWPQLVSIVTIFFSAAWLLISFKRKPL